MKNKSSQEFHTDFPPSFIANLQKGVMRTCYRNIPMYKSPFDLVLYLQLIARQRPASVIEIGTKYGGSALWFADMLSLHGLDPGIISIDIQTESQVEDPRIHFIQGDVMNLGDVLSETRLAALPRPWLIVEDSAHYYETCLAALVFFDQYMQPGDYIVVEDGIVAELPQASYGRYRNGPNRAVADFIEGRPGRYEVDVDLCNFYGRNITYNPNAWLRRISD